MHTTLLINEVFHSIQGESTWSGLRCAFVRLMGCHLRCNYCDTEYAFHQGTRRSIDDLVAEVLSYGCPLVEVTGGEPLLQPGVHTLMTKLADAGLTVLIETSGACDISTCDSRVIRIMDLKTPGSGEVARNLWTNIAHLNERDEVKFVLCSREDYDWAKEIIAEHDLTNRVRSVLFAAVAPMARGLEILGSPGLDLRSLASWVIEDRLNVRMQTQLHKIIWDPSTRGV